MYLFVIVLRPVIYTEQITRTKFLSELNLTFGF